VLLPTGTARLMMRPQSTDVNGRGGSERDEGEKWMHPLLLVLVRLSSLFFGSYSSTLLLFPLFSLSSLTYTRSL